MCVQQKFAFLCENTDGLYTEEINRVEMISDRVSFSPFLLAHFSLLFAISESTKEIHKYENV